MSGSGRIHAESVKAKFFQAGNQSAVTTPDVKDARACGKRRRDGRVEVLPPPRAGHRPEPYPEAVSRRDCRGATSLSLVTPATDTDEPGQPQAVTDPPSDSAGHKVSVGLAG